MAWRLGLGLAKALAPFVFGFSPPLLSVAKRFTSVTSASRTPTPIFAITWLAMALPKLLRVEMKRVEHEADRADALRGGACRSRCAQRFSRAMSKPVTSMSAGRPAS